ncbi:hypothetical protein EMIHUDRAFT_468213, partial [Emiliania huxleyi CCMP1516]
CTSRCCSSRYSRAALRSSSLRRACRRPPPRAALRPPPSHLSTHRRCIRSPLSWPRLCRQTASARTARWTRRCGCSRSARLLSLQPHSSRSCSRPARRPSTSSRATSRAASAPRTESIAHASRALTFPCLASVAHPVCGSAAHACDREPPS